MVFSPLELRALLEHPGQWAPKKVGAQAGKAAHESGVLARGAMMISTKAPARPSGLPLPFPLTDSA